MADIICRYCGRVNRVSNITCSYCRKPLPSAKIKKERLKASLTADEEDYIQTNVTYYEPIFLKLRGQNGRVSWNWVSSVFPVCWFFYRKIYGWGIAAVVITSFICCFGGVVTLIMALIFRLFTGIYGNYFYLLHVERVIRNGLHFREPIKSLHLKRRGGTSPILAGLSLAIMTAIEVLIIYFFYS